MLDITDDSFEDNARRITRKGYLIFPNWKVYKRDFVHLYWLSLGYAPGLKDENDRRTARAIFKEESSTCYWANLHRWGPTKKDFDREQAYAIGGYIEEPCQDLARAIMARGYYTCLSNAFRASPKGVAWRTSFNARDYRVGQFFTNAEFFTFLRDGRTFKYWEKVEVPELKFPVRPIGLTGIDLVTKELD